MSSTFSTNLNLQLQGTGDNVNTYGVVLNTSVFANIDQALGSPYAANVAGSADVTLSQTNALNLAHNLTGILTGSISYIFPASAGRMVIVNNATSGAFTVTVKASGGTGVVVPQGTRQLVLLDSAANTAYLVADVSTRLTNALTSANLFVGNGSNIATGVAASGDLTLANTGAFTIANNAVTNAKSAQMIAHTYKGNNTGSTANAADITSTQLTADLNAFTSSLQGMVPASGGGTTNFLRADGSFAAPATAPNAPVLLSSQTVSGAGTLSFTGFMSATYPLYKIYLYNVYGASAAALWARYGIATSYIATSTYNSALWGRDSAGNTEVGDNPAAAQILMSGANLQATSTQGGTWEITIYNPSHSAETHITWEGSYKTDSLARYNSHVGSGQNTGTSAITDIQFLMSTGNINATGRMYGLP